MYYGLQIIWFFKASIVELLAAFLAFKFLGALLTVFKVVEALTVFKV